MSEFSRLKKNQALYAAIKADSEASLSESDLLDLKKRLEGSKIDQEVVEKGFARKKEVEFDELTDLDSTLSSDELIKSFISEVKKYNIKSGLRTVEDTNLNILKELEREDKEDSNTNIVSPSEPIIEAKPFTEATEDLEVTKQNISEEIRRLLEEDPSLLAGADAIKEELLKPTSENELSKTAELKDPSLEVEKTEVAETELIDNAAIEKALNKDRWASFFLFVSTLFFMVAVSLFVYWLLTKGA